MTAAARAPTAFGRIRGRFGGGSVHLVHTALALSVVALVLRHGMLGDPLAGFDEQFYLLVGDRMWRGALPYVDIWDRKPLGLFVIYAAIRSLGGDGVVQSHLVATGFAAATAVTIARLAMDGRTDPRARWVGFAAGALYLLMLNVFRGEVGQAPVFFNLFVALGACGVIAVTDDPLGRRAVAYAYAAMLACGVALTVKTTAVFESVWFGMSLLAVWLRAGVPHARVAKRALAMAALGAAPFLACAAPYVLAGEVDAFWFANARSAMLRPRAAGAKAFLPLLGTIVLLLPLVTLNLGSMLDRAPSGGKRTFLIGWIAAASAAMLSVGIYFEHYAMNMLVPLSIGGAAVLRRRWIGPPAFAATALAPLHLALVTLPETAASDRAQYAELMSAITPAVRRHCMLVYGGPPILYHASQACLPTAYAFPGHFWLRNEAPALGVDGLAELKRALAKRPAVIVTARFGNKEERLAHADDLVRDALADDYRLKRVVRTRIFDWTEPVTIWERRDPPSSL